MQLPRRLVARGAVGDLVLTEQQRAGGDRIAARHVEFGDEALLGRTDFDEIGFGISLPLRRRRRPVLVPPQANADRRRERDDKTDQTRATHQIVLCNATISLHYRGSLPALQWRCSARCPFRCSSLPRSAAAPAG